MQVTVTHEEAQVLADLLNAYLPELHDEADKTESLELSEQLKRREIVLRALLTRLGVLLNRTRPC
jgi:hypothetical protein